MPKLSTMGAFIFILHFLIEYSMIEITVLHGLQTPTGSQIQSGIQMLQTIPNEIPPDQLLWIDAESPTEQELNQLQQRFKLDSYAIEDIVQGNQRSKVEEYSGNTFSVIHVPTKSSGKAARANQKFDIVELFIFFADRWLISVHSHNADIIKEVEARVRARGLSPLTSNPTPDLLYYVFLDFAVDSYYPMLDNVEEEIERLEKQAVTDFKTRKRRVQNVSSIMSLMGGLRNELMTMRKSLSPTRDMLSMIMKGAVPFVSDSNLRNFRDVYDHTFQLMETIDTNRDRTSDVRDLYISMLAASTDNIIKVLTIVATVLLPLTLLAGIYGMNFTSGFFEPGSGVWFGFYVLIAGMVSIALALTFLFRKAGWI
jgi:magnesium transporter